MGFYHPATVIEDAKRHGITMLPVDVCQSGWDCTLEPESAPELAPGAGPPPPLAGEDGGGEARPRPGREAPRTPPWAVRMGLRYLKGFGEEEGRRIVAARSEAPFTGLSDFAARSGLGEARLLTLATAGALAGLQGLRGLGRRAALWEARGEKRIPKATLSITEPEPPPAFRPLDALEVIAWDRLTAGHSVRGHPLAPLRKALRDAGLPDARMVEGMSHGRAVRYAGMVINRQRPATAGGVVFMTLEDETGFVNLVVWERVFEQYFVLARMASFLGVSGRLQVQDGVVHLIVQRFWEPALRHVSESHGSGSQPESDSSGNRLGREPPSQPSRDFR